MSILSTNLYGSSTNKGVGGLLSGLDTDELVNQMTAATRNKINRQYQSKQKLLYRQEAYREISTKLLSFSNKYFSYSSGSKTNILSPKFFESYTYKPSSSYVNITGNAENIKNFEINKIESVATAASFTSNKTVAVNEFSSENITAKTSTIAGATFSLEFGSKNYSFSIDKGFGNGPDNITVDEAVAQLNEKLKVIDGNSSNELLKYTVDGNGQIVFEKGTAKLIAASNAFTENLNMKTGDTAISTAKVENLTKDTLSILQNKGLSITFDFNGVTKTVYLAEEVEVPSVDGSGTEKITLSDATSLKRYIQNELDKTYGQGKVVINDTDNKLSFSAADGSTNIFGISSISKELSDFTGLESGDYNRLNKNKSLKDLGFKQDVYKMSINGAEIEFKNSMSVTDVINTINNNAEAGAKVYYSSTTNTFTVKAIEAGTHKGVSIVDVENGGNLAQTLFGTGIDLNRFINENEYIKTENGIQNIYSKSDDAKIGTILYDKENRKYTLDYMDGKGVDIETSEADYHINNGTDTVMTYTLNGVQNKISRSTANFTIDEINIELNEKAASQATTDSPITFNVTNNADEVVERVKQFVNDYNEIINLIGTKASEKPKRDYLPLTPEQQDEMEEEEIKDWNIEAKKGALYGDSKMNSVLRRMRESMSGLTDVSSITLSNIGISSANMDTSGKLVLDETKFKQKLLENPDEIANLFTLTSSKTTTDAKSGIALQLQKILRDNVGVYGTSGLLIKEAGMDRSMTSDRNYISEKMKEYDDKMADLKKDLEGERKRYWDQFSALEQSMNKLNAQSSWLTDMMG